MHKSYLAKVTLCLNLSFLESTVLTSRLRLKERGFMLLLKMKVNINNVGFWSRSAVLNPNLHFPSKPL